MRPVVLLLSKAYRKVPAKERAALDAPRGPV